MNAVLEHLDQVSVFGRSPVALFFILGLDWAFTAVHDYEEWRGAKAPLWRVFGAVVGVWVPNWIGFLSFTVALTLLLWSVGLAGIVGWLPFIGHLTPAITVGALGAVIGARISDTIVSHWGLYSLGYRPNPGLKSTPLYILEAVFVLLTFWKGLSLASSCGRLGGCVRRWLFYPGAPDPRSTANYSSPLATCSLEAMGAPPRMDKRLAALPRIGPLDGARL
jgi:hypothetical protein